MSFLPPRCPHVSCPAHREPSRRRFVRWGYFSARCRADREQRFRCGLCRRTCSRQTFRYDYRERRPDRNELLFDLLTSGVGLRQSARVLHVGATTAQKKMHKMARHCARLHDNLSPRLPAGRSYLMDEEESFEGASIRPLTMPVVIERQTWFVVATTAGPIRRLARPGTARRRRQERDEARRGRRADRSRACVKRVLCELARRVEGPLSLQTDEKPSYARLAREIFGDRVRHTTTPGSAARTTGNRLFPINTTLAMTRDNCGRLRRRSWLVSKRRRWLRGQMAIFAVYRNYVRRRFNRDRAHQTPAEQLGLLPRQLWPSEVLTWRQDWGALSAHPLSFLGDRAVAQTAAYASSAEA